jgi:hypothetical protein
VSNRDDNGRFQEGHKIPQRHGGAAAYRAITTGEPFDGLAAEEEQRVVTDLANGGQRSMLEELAVRLHTCARLYYAALQSAVDKGDLEKLDTYAKRFGWIAGKAGKAWRDLGEVDPMDLDVIDAIAAAKEANSDD